MRRQNAPILLLLIVLGVLGYLLPWVITPSNSLSIGAYDLAEWTSLHPIVRQTLPFLWTTLLLRLPLAILGVLLASYVGSAFSRLVGFGIIVLTAIALLPPIEFFTTYRDDSNYQQQFVLTVLVLIIGSLLVGWQNKYLQRILPVLLSLLGCLSALVGLVQGYGLLRGFDLPTSIGYGGLITAVSLGAICLITTKQSSLATLFVKVSHTNTAN
jgi:hypothetical protein